MPIVSNQQIKINRILHFKCNLHYFEIEDNEIEICPHCKAEIKEEDITPDIGGKERYIYADPFTGKLKVTTEKRLDVILKI